MAPKGLIPAFKAHRSRVSRHDRSKTRTRTSVVALEGIIHYTIAAPMF